MGDYMRDHHDDWLLRVVYDAVATISWTRPPLKDHDEAWLLRMVRIAVRLLPVYNLIIRFPFLYFYLGEGTIAIVIFSFVNGLFWLLALRLGSGRSLRLEPLLSKLIFERLRDDGGPGKHNHVDALVTC